MRIVIFGLTITSSWGNGHATIWRGLCSALEAEGHAVTFFEHDVAYYASHRDLPANSPFEVVLYSDWSENAERARACLKNADAAIVTSYCPDAEDASDLVLESDVSAKIFYDLDSPVTLERWQANGTVEYIPHYGLEPFDLVLSYAGGSALTQLKELLGARNVAPLYGSVDPATHRRAAPSIQYESDLSYLGTYAQDRQTVLQELFIEPARRAPEKRFVLGGSLYPEHFPWTENMYFVRHVIPPEHPAFYSSSKLTLNVTRAAMANTGYCPSGRLFEAAACATPVLSDDWEGLDSFFEPGSEILIASSTSEVVDALLRDEAELRKIGTAARERVLDQHTSWHRSLELVQLIEGCA